MLLPLVQQELLGPRADAGTWSAATLAAFVASLLHLEHVATSGASGASSASDDGPADCRDRLRTWSAEALTAASWVVPPPQADRWILETAPEVQLALLAALAAEHARAHRTEEALCLLAERLLGGAAPVLVRGRVLALRARALRHMGDVSTATHLYRQLVTTGRRVAGATGATGAFNRGSSGASELVGRGLVGLAILAQAAGRYPEARRGYRAALALPGLPSSVAGLAHHGLMGAAIVASRYEEAAQHTWAALSHAGTPIEEADLLLSCGKLALETGAPDTALQCYVGSLVRRPPARIRLAALAGVLQALARGAPAQQASVLAASAWQSLQSFEGTLDATSAQYAYERADAMLDAGLALEALGRGDEAAAALAQARAIAERHAVHEVTHRLAAREEEATSATTAGTTTAGTMAAGITGAGMTPGADGRAHRSASRVVRHAASRVAVTGRSPLPPSLTWREDAEVLDVLAEAALA